MNSALLFKKFHRGIIWNAIVYTTEKLSYLMVSYTLFALLNTQFFSLWANLNSIIYLTLLWADLGMRKAIPLFIPRAAHKKRSRDLLSLIIKIQFFALGAAVIILYCTFSRIAALLSLTLSGTTILLTLLLLFVEGLVALARLIFHANFLHKAFNITNTVVAIGEACLNLALIIFLPKTLVLVHALLLSRIITASIIVIISCTIFNHKTQEVSQGVSMRTSLLPYEFLKHSLIMWGGITSKSLSERNFLLPFFTYIFGPHVGNLYKVANDAALLFQRTLIKTIGTVDTTILAHAHMSKNNSLLFTTFNHLKKTITLLIIPLILFMLPVLMLRLFMFHNSVIVQDSQTYLLFILLVSTYIIESFLSPYERLLEVKQQYISLFIAQLPYLLTMAIILSSPTIIYTHGFIFTMILIQSSRLCNAYLNIRLVKRQYQEQIISATQNWNIGHKIYKNIQARIKPVTKQNQR